jgi:hypothetical protein
MAQENKGSFVLYFDYRKHLEFLTDAECGQLFKALLDYGETKKEPELEGAARMAFSFIACQMDRDAQKYAETCRKRSESGKKGGRPKKADAEEKANKANGFLEKQTKAKKADNDNENDTDTENDNDNDTDNVENNKLFSSTTPSIPQGGNVAPAAAEQTPYKAIVEMYHEICKSFPRVKKVGDNRKKAIAARWKEYGHDLETFRELFEKAEASSFLKGRNKRNWAADFTWLMNSDNMAKVLEGKYDEKTGGNGRREPVPGWMESSLGEEELDAIQRMMKGQPKTAGNDPTVAERAEKLKQQLSG